MALQHLPRMRSAALGIAFAGLIVGAATGVGHGASGSAAVGGPVEAIRYEVVTSPDAADLSVEVSLPAGLDSALTVDPQAQAFVEGLAILESGRWISLRAARGAWRAPSCRRTGCRLRYVFHLRAAARTLDDPDTAAEREQVIVGPASTWLIRPLNLPDVGLRGRLHVNTTAPITFVTGLSRMPGIDDTYDVVLLPFFMSPYSAFGRFDVQTLRIGGAALDMAVAVPALGDDLTRLRVWVTSAASAVSSYFGRFPVDHALILVVPQSAGVHGKALGGGGATVLLQVAPGADLKNTAHDWMAAHEMIHLAVPDMPRAQLWLTEGLATYIEPLARAMTAELRPESVWRDLVLGLPKGLPAPGDRGLDRTHTWGRTYWGGALFAFVADLEIRKATNGDQSLATALQGVLHAGGDARVFWPVERFTAACDRALGRPILTDLYRRMAEQPVDVDLRGIWRGLGVSVTGGQVDLDDRAPLASIRRRMIGVANRAP